MLAARVMSNALCPLGFDISAEEVLTALVGLDADASREVLEDRFKKKLPSDFDTQVTEMLNIAFTQELKTLPGIKDLIAGLRQPFCVASNSSHERLVRTFAATGLAALLSGKTFSAEDVKRGKPAPDLFLYAADQMGSIPAEDCLVIEDSVTGVTAAVAAGMRVIGFCGGSHIRPGHDQKLISLGAERIITSHRQLSEFLEPTSATLALSDA